MKTLIRILVNELLLAFGTPLLLAQAVVKARLGKSCTLGMSYFLDALTKAPIIKGQRLYLRCRAEALCEKDLTMEHIPQLRMPL